MGTTPEITAAIAIGSNVGDRMSHIAAAMIALAAMPQTKMLARGPVVQTAPLAPTQQADRPLDTGGTYFNTVAVIATKLAPELLLAELHRIERLAGRDRTQEPRRWMPRTLDLDLLLYGDSQIVTAELTVPHPRMVERWFVLEPLAAVLPEAMVPGTGKRVHELLAGVARSEGSV